MTRLVKVIGVCLLVGALSTAAWAIPQMINYQGAMVDTSGVPVDSTLSITFRMWNDPVSVLPGDLLWNETQPVVVITDGLFNVLLGSVNNIPLSVFDDDSVWLEVKVGLNPAMTPRQRIASVAYAFHAWYADTAGVALIGPGVSYARVYTVAEAGGDFTSVAAAIAAIPLPGPPYLIRVMAGTYNEPAFTIPGNVTLRGAGRDCTFLIVNGGITMNQPSAMITGFYIRTSSSAVGGIDVTAEGITICDNYITNEYSDGITISGDWKTIIHDNRIRNCEGYGVLAQDGASPFIHDNAISDNASGGVQFYESGGTLSNNKIFGNSMYGVFLQGMTSIEAVLTVDDNQIGNHNTGIMLMLEYSEPRIMGNEIRANNTYGIEVVAGFAHIVANTISRCSGAGIAVAGDMASAHIVGNNIWDNQMYGLECSGGGGGATNSVVSSNIIILNGQDIWYPGPAIPPFTFNNNTFDSSPGLPAPGRYNVDSNGNPIAP